MAWPFKKKEQPSIKESPIMPDDSDYVVLEEEKPKVMVKQKLHKRDKIIPKARPGLSLPAEANPLTHEQLFNKHFADKGQTKNTGTIRFHNDFINKLKELKGPDISYEQYLRQKLSL